MTNKQAEEKQADEKKASVNVRGAKPIGEVLPTVGWPELPRRDFESLEQDKLGDGKTRPIVFIDCIKLHSGKFKNDFGVAKCVDPDSGEEFTTACGAVVTDKLMTIKENGDFPVLATPTFVKGGDFGRYWDLT